MMTKQIFMHANQSDDIFFCIGEQL